MQQHTNKLGIIVSDRKQHVMNDLFGFTCIYMYTVLTVHCSLFIVQQQKYISKLNPLNVWKYIRKLFIKVSYDILALYDAFTVSLQCLTIQIDFILFNIVDQLSGDDWSFCVPFHFGSFYYHIYFFNRHFCGQY